MEKEGRKEGMGWNAVIWRWRGLLMPWNHELWPPPQKKKKNLLSGFQVNDHLPKLSHLSDCKYDYETNLGAVHRLETNLELLLIQGFAVVDSITCVRSCRPLFILLIFSAGLVECPNFFGRTAWAEENLTPNKTCRRCQQIDLRPTGTNTTNWM